MVPVISFIGRHNSGKTTVLTGVIDNLSSAGYRVAVIKHAHHGLNIEAHKDSDLFLQAGANFVLASAPGLSIQYRRQENELELSQIMEQLPADIDLVIVEGFKNEALPKIEVLRSEIDTEAMLLPQTLAMVSDFSLPANIPVFDSKNIAAITCFILRELGLETAKE